MARESGPRGSIMRALALLMLIGIGSTCATESRQDPNALRTALETQNARLSEAFSHRDPAAMGQLYVEDAQAFPPGTPPVTGRSAIQEMWKGVLALPIARFQLETVEVDGNATTAWETGRYTMLATNGSTMDAGKYITVWKRDDTGWKIYRDMWSSDNLPQAPEVSQP